MTGEIAGTPLIAGLELHRWRCAKGHEMEGGAQGFTIQFSIGSSVVTTNPLCIFCLAEALNEKFSAEKALEEPTPTS